MATLRMDIAEIHAHPYNNEQTIAEQSDHDYSVESISDSTTEVSDFEEHGDDDAVAERPGNRAQLMPGIELSEEQEGECNHSGPVLC